MWQNTLEDLNVIRCHIWIPRPFLAVFLRVCERVRLGSGCGSQRWPASNSPASSSKVVPLFFVLCETCLRFLPPLLLCVFAVVTWKTCVGFLPVCWDDYSRARCAPSEPRLKSWLTGGNSLWMLISLLQSLQFHIVMLAQLECNHVRLTDWGTDRQTNATGWRTWGPERMSRQQMDAGAGQIQGFSCRCGFYWVGLKRLPGKQRVPEVIVSPQRSGSLSHTPLLLGAGG